MRREVRVAVDARDVVFGRGVRLARNENLYLDEDLNDGGYVVFSAIQRGLVTDDDMGEVMRAWWAGDRFGFPRTGDLEVASGGDSFAEVLSDRILKRFEALSPAPSPPQHRVFKGAVRDLAWLVIEAGVMVGMQRMLETWSGWRRLPASLDVQRVVDARRRRDGRSVELRADVPGLDERLQYEIELRQRALRRIAQRRRRIAKLSREAVAGESSSGDGLGTAEDSPLGEDEAADEELPDVVE